MSTILNLIRALAVVAALALMPRWNPTGNRYTRGEDAANTVASGARTANGNSGTLDASGFSQLAAYLNVTAVSGTTPSMTVTVEESHDGTTWRTVGSFAAKTAVSNERKSFSIAESYYRYTWTITGTTPSFTFTIDEAKK